MAPWIDVGSENVIFVDDIVAVVDWISGRMSQSNRELVGYARAHGFLIEDGDSPKASLLVTKDKVLLLAASTGSIRKKLDRT